MGDISELRGLVIIGSFLACFALIASLIPPQLFPSYVEGRQVEAPEYFDAVDLQSFANTSSYVLNETGGESYPYNLYRLSIDIGGHNLDLFYREPNTTEYEMLLYIRHFFAEWWGWVYDHDLEWINSEGYSRDFTLEATELNNDFQDGRATYKVECPHFFIRVYFGYNETFSSPEEAWNYGALNMLVGIDFDQVSTGYNAWSLIALILFFQMPDIHWIINAIIAVPIWIAVAYISFILILRTIGAIFGGGA